MTGGREVAITPRVCEHLIAVRERIAAATREPAARRGRDARRRLEGAARRRPSPPRSAADRRDFGENRAQELLAKAVAFGPADPAPVWHFVGRLQRNKVRSLAPHVARWHSIDRIELGAELARHAPATPCLRAGQRGAASRRRVAAHPRRRAALVDQLRDAGHRVDGLMTVPPADADPRPHFAALRELAEQVGVPELSMGMTGDFEAAIGEGATYVRVGSAVFGPRPGGVGLRR